MPNELLLMAESKAEPISTPSEEGQGETEKKKKAATLFYEKNTQNVFKKKKEEDQEDKSIDEILDEEDEEIKRRRKLRKLKKAKKIKKMKKLKKKKIKRKTNKKMALARFSRVKISNALTPKNTLNASFTPKLNINQKNMRFARLFSQKNLSQSKSQLISNFFRKKLETKKVNAPIAKRIEIKKRDTSLFRKIFK